MPPLALPPTLPTVPSPRAQLVPLAQRLPLVVLLALALDPGAAASAAERDDTAELTQAYLRTDFDRLARAGRRLSARGLAPIITGTRVIEARAAIAAAPYAEDAWQLLDVLARLALSPDRQLGPPASRAAAVIAQKLDPARIAELEIATEQLRERANAWRAVATRAGTWPDVRVHALEVNAVLVAVLPERARGGVDLDLPAIAGDPEPEVRRAALELEPQPLAPQAARRIAEILRADSSPVVAVVAAQVLCGGLAMGDDAAPVLAAIAEAGLERLHNLVGNRNLPPRARVDAGYCLRASGDVADHKALAALKGSVPVHYAREAAALLKKKPAGKHE